MSSKLRGILAVSLITAFAAPAFAEGDVTKGEKVFKKCAACHATEAAGAQKAGPHLEAIVGRKTAGVEGYTYSAKMRALGDEGHVWSAEELAKFLENPKAMVPGTKMSFAGLKKEDERVNLVAYLATLGGAEAAPAEAPAAAPADAAPAEAPADAPAAQ